MALRSFARPKKNSRISGFDGSLRSRPFASGLPIQAKLAVGQPNDKYEQEADQVADQVVGNLQRMENRQEEVQMKPDLQRETMAEEEEEVMMKSEGNDQAEVNDEVASTINQAKGSGSALPDIFRSKVEQAIGADFSGVRVHTDQTSDTLSRSLSARAFTTGNDIFFKQGEYNPNSTEGQKLITHELTHTLQQNASQSVSLKPDISFIQRLSSPNDSLQMFGLVQRQQAGHNSGCSCASCTGKIQTKSESNYVQEGTHDSGCSCPSCSGTTTQIQAKLDPQVHSRAAYKSGGLKAGFTLGTTSFGKILNLLDSYHKTDNGDRIKQKNILQEILQACDDWLNSKTRNAKKSSKKKQKEDDKKNQILSLKIDANSEIQSIETTLDTSLFDNGLKTEMLNKIVAGVSPAGGSDTRTDNELATAYNSLENDLDQYAKRTTQKKDTDFTSRDSLSLVLKALSLPRQMDGSLSPEAIYLMSVYAAEEAQGYVDKGKEITDKMGKANINDKQVRQNVDFGLGIKNKVTGKTAGSELLNLTNPSKFTNPDQQVIDTVSVGGVSMRVYHSIADVNFEARLAMFSKAIQLITGAGFTLPGNLLVHLPKFGQNNDQVSQCTISGSTPRAVFNAPNFIHVRGDVVGNPIDTEDKGGTSAAGEYHNLSTKILAEGTDTTGAASVVHEMGHMMHYRTSPGKFFGLHGTSFKGNGAQIAAEVSGYASNPREFVAEVFMGLIYGKNFSDDVLRMYRDLGGAIPGSLAGYVANL